MDKFKLIYTNSDKFGPELFSFQFEHAAKDIVIGIKKIINVLAFSNLLSLTDKFRPIYTNLDMFGHELFLFQFKHAVKDIVIGKQNSKRPCL